MLRAAILLTISNVFMTFAWYGHLRFTHRALWAVVLASWGIAFFEYCFQVPANRIGYEAGVSAAELKTLQEVITLTVFVGFAVWYLGEPIRWNVVVGFALIAAGATFVFAPWSRGAGEGGVAVDVSASSTDGPFGPRGAPPPPPPAGGGSVAPGLVDRSRPVH